MSVEINFTLIRPLSGSRNSGFEELCCQLARMSRHRSVGKFVRKEGAGGDAGVECYWKLNDGSEVAWQAKYFFDLGDSQWRQLDKSVRHALTKLAGMGVHLLDNLRLDNLSAACGRSGRWTFQFIITPLRVDKGRALR